VSLQEARNDAPDVDDRRRVIERWTEVWNEGRLEWIGELVADPCLRHHPGKLDTLTTAQNVDRVRAGRERFGRVSFENVVLVAAGEYVTSCYTMRFDDPDNPGVRRESAGIEVFRVVGGRITETWNTDPGAGPWR
jgi:predicted SnoaL-like aldol condensation-catalyzing enzyme